jgi:hypothetical protein
MAPRWQAGMGCASGLILEPHTYLYLYIDSGKNNIFFEFCFHLAIPAGATGHYSLPGPGNPVPGHRFRYRYRWNNLGSLEAMSAHIYTIEYSVHTLSASMIMLVYSHSVTQYTMYEICACPASILAVS